VGVLKAGEKGWNGRGGKKINRGRKTIHQILCLMMTRVITRGHFKLKKEGKGRGEGKRVKIVTDKIN